MATHLPNFSRRTQALFEKVEGVPVSMINWSAMRGTIRLLLCLLLASSLAFAAVPHQPRMPEIEKTDCCTKMKADAADQECNHQAPKPDPDKQCRSVCALCLAGVLTAATLFVYPPNGDETFAAYISSEHTRSHRPPVPPPRA